MRKAFEQEKDLLGLINQIIGLANDLDGTLNDVQC